jgi:hypothetical protein
VLFKHAHGQDQHESKGDHATREDIGLATWVWPAKAGVTKAAASAEKATVKILNFILFSRGLATVGRGSYVVNLYSEPASSQCSKNGHGEGKTLARSISTAQMSAWCLFAVRARLNLCATSSAASPRQKNLPP